MKKLFFFRSSSSSNENSKQSSPSSKTDREEVYWEKPFDNRLNNNQVNNDKVENNSSGLRRSRSLSSAAFQASGLGQKDFASLGDQIRSPSSSSSRIQHHKSNHSPRNEMERPCSSDLFDSHDDSSRSSSQSSSNASTTIVDRYIDGEQIQESSSMNNKLSSQGKHIPYGNGGGRLPPRVQYTAPASPTNVIKEKAKSNSFRETKGTRLPISSKDWNENGYGNESPRRLAKNVIERLSQCHVIPKSRSKGFNSETPITIEDIYGGSLNRCSSFNDLAKKTSSLDENYETAYVHEEEISGLQNQNHGIEDDLVDVELRRKLKEAEERVEFYSDQLGEEIFLRDARFDVPGLVNTIKNLTEERISLALEVSGLLENQINERAVSKEELRLVKAEMEGQTKKLEREKNVLQSSLEKELDRRSSDWSYKLERYKSEEQRLRDRVRELAEQNVSLQREVSSYSEREMESKNVMTYSEEKLNELTIRLENVTNDNQSLRQSFIDLQEMYRGSIEDRDCVHRKYEDKEKECTELHKSITRLLRINCEHEKTIEGLREGFNEEIGKKQQSVEKFDKHVRKMQKELLRLAGVEQALRKEVESYRLEVNSLRHENISLLNRIRGNSKEGGCLTVKLDEELWNRISCLQNQGISLLNESTNIFSKLLDFIKRKAGHNSEVMSGLDGKLLMEFETKAQCLKRGTESLARSLQTMSGLLHEKSIPLDNGSLQLNTLSSEDMVKYELKAETLMTCLLREKIYSKELEVEQLQAELATAVRGNDILRCEVQNALDNFSCASHKLKEIELQMLKKDENMSQIESELQESTTELTITKGILPKVSEERDLMWEEVKLYREKNMLLIKEVNELKKKIEDLEEAVLVKEGEMTILKDNIGKKPFDLLGSPDFNDFLLN